MILSALSSKNPQVKEGTLKFMHRCLTTTTTPPSPNQVKPLSEMLGALLEDSSEAARSEAAQCLGTLMKIIGERPLNAIMDSLDDVRKIKVRDAYQNASVSVRSKSLASNPQAKALEPPAQVMPKKAQPVGSTNKLSPSTAPLEEQAEARKPLPGRGPPARLIVKASTAITTPMDRSKPTVPVKKAAPTAVLAKVMKSNAVSDLDAVKFAHSPEDAESLAADLIPSSIA